MLLEDGWFITRQKGSHRQFKHPSKRGLVTVNGKNSDVLDQLYLETGRMEN